VNNSKLINLLRAFSKGEMKDFEKMIESAFFSKGRNYMPLFREIKKFYPRFDDDKMTAEYLFAKMNPGKKFNKQIIWNMSSSLLNIAEEYLIQAALKKNDFLRHSLVTDEVYYRKLPKHCAQKLDAMEKSLGSVGLGSNYFYNKIQLEISKTNLLFLEDKQHLVPRHMQEEGESAVAYILIILSNVINNMNYNMLLFNTKYDVNIAYEFINNIDLKKVVEYAVLKEYKFAYVLEMYYCMIMSALKPDDSSYFMKAKELFEKNTKYLESEERETLLGVLCNYCIYKINDGEAEFKRMLFEVNLLQLKEIEEKRKREFGKIFYMQALRNALLINEIEWAKKYIEKYTPFLKHSIQRPVRALAEAYLAFKLKEFDKVIEYLSKVRFIDNRDKFIVKSITLMAYYELNELPALVYNIETTKQFISKNPSLGKITRENFNTFLIHLKKILDIKEKGNFAKTESVKMEIEKDRGTVNRTWLLEKIEELSLSKAYND